MESRAKIAGHSAHSMLIVFPLGLLTTAVLFDIIYLFTNDIRWTEIAYYLIGAGVVGGLLAAPFGLIDWLRIPRGTRAKRVGLLHGLGNLIVLALFVVSWLLRREAIAMPPTQAIVAALAGGVLSVITGWLGGELVGRLGVGVDDGANLNAPSALSALPAGPRSPVWTGIERRLHTVPAYVGTERRRAHLR